MKLCQVYSITATLDDCLIIDVDYTGLEGRRRGLYPYRASDQYSPLTPLITHWLEDNPHQILPYVLPLPPTPQELRERMPTLSGRQFWLAANTLGITEEMLLAATDDPEIIIEIRKTTDFYRTYDSVVMLAPLMGITPEQLDDVWRWSAVV